MWSGYFYYVKHLKSSSIFDHRHLNNEAEFAEFPVHGSFITVEF